jgi:hypothetical protein
MRMAMRIIAVHCYAQSPVSELKCLDDWNQFDAETGVTYDSAVVSSEDNTGAVSGQVILPPSKEKWAVYLQPA